MAKYYKGYILGFICLVITNLLGAYIPQLIKSAINLLQRLQETASEAQVLDILMWIAGLAVVMAFVRTVSRQVVFGIGRQIEFDLKKDIFDHLITLEPQFFTENRTGDLISIITNDVQSIRGLGGFAMLNIANTIIAFAVVLPLMFDIHTKLTWAFLGTIPLVIIFVIALSSNIKKFQNLVQESLGAVSNFIEQNISGIHIIKAYAQEASEIARFKTFNDELRENYIKLVGVRSLIGPTMRVIGSLGFILLLYIGGQSVIEKTFSVGDFAAFTLYIQRLIWPVATLGWLITLIYRAQVSEKRINTILHTKPAIADKDNAIDKKDLQDSIELKALGASIKKGTTTAIIGTIGSGKTILCSKLMHLRELGDDEILIDGVDIRDIKLESLRSLINIVPQENFLFSTTIAENIAYAKELDREEVECLAKLVNLHDEIMRFDGNYESVVGEKGVTLSGGQRQRMAIARAMALNPEVLILDDALSHLDDASSSLILKNILELREGKTTIFITHKTKIIQDFDQILVMDNGQVVMQGKHNALYEDANPLYRELLAKGVKVEK